MRGTGLWWCCKLHAMVKMDWSTAKCYGSDSICTPVTMVLTNWAISPSGWPDNQTWDDYSAWLCKFSLQWQWAVLDKYFTNIGLFSQWDCESCSYVIILHDFSIFCTSYLTNIQYNLSNVHKSNLQKSTIPLYRSFYLDPKRFPVQYYCNNILTP